MRQIRGLVNSIGMTFVLIQAGEPWLRSPSREIIGDDDKVRCIGAGSVRRFIQGNMEQPMDLLGLPLRSIQAVGESPLNAADSKGCYTRSESCWTEAAQGLP